MIGTALVTLPVEKLIRETAGTIEKYAGLDFPPPGAGHFVKSINEIIESTSERNGRH
jgi:hypothetical protein